MFFILVFSIWGFVLSHIFLRTKRLLRLRGWQAGLLAAMIFLLGFMDLPARVLVYSGSYHWSTVALAHAGAWALGLTGMVWMLLLIFELVALAARISTGFRIRNTAPSTGRRLAAVLWGTALFLAVAGSFTARSTPSVTRLEVTVPGSEARRFAMISDVHLGATASTSQWRRTLQTASESRPDALFIVGDLVDDHSPETRKQAGLLREFFPRTTIYATTGNHEYYSGPEPFLALCDELDIRLLRQTVEPLSPGLRIAGVDDEHFLKSPEAVEAIRPLMQGPVLLLSHRPTVARLVEERPETLVVSGHTHGGQMPPMVFLVALGNGGIRRGLHQVGEATLYVSMGTGTWGPPMRILTRPELVLIDVRPGPRFGCTRKTTPTRAFSSESS